jgi:hypothetical protein
MKILFLLFFFFLLTILVLKATNLNEQSNKNQIFLQKLDENLLSTLHVLEVFNHTARNMEDVEGAAIYERFLLDVTMECGKIRSSITHAQTELNQEEAIKSIILTLRSDLNLQSNNANIHTDVANKIELERIKTDLIRRISKIRKEIVREEKQIWESKKISRNYLGYHSHHFLYSLLLNYLEASDYLSMQNRDFLKQIILIIMNSL